MIRRIALRLATRALARGRFKTLMTRDGTKEYLTRIFLYGSDEDHGARLCVHVMRLSDEGSLHNHRWPFLSIVLYGGFYELLKHRRVWRRPMSAYFRGMNTFHRVQLPAGRIAITLVFMFPRVRNEWGFLVKLSKNYWMPWKWYLRHFFKRVNV